MMMGIVIQCPSWAWNSMSSSPLAWCTFSRVNTNAQSSRMNHWLRPATYSTITEPAMIAQKAHRAPSSVAAHAAPRRTRASTSTDHHLPPQLQQLNRAAGDRRQTEELRLAVRTAVVVHRHLDEAGTRTIERSHHLDADHAGGRCQRSIDDQLTAEHAEVTVRVAHGEVEQQLDDVVVEAADLVPLHDVDLGGGQRYEEGRFGGVVLGVAVRVEDPLVTSRREAADQRLPVS